MTGNWLCWLYQYGLGGLLFLGILGSAVQTRALRLDSPSDRRLLIILLIGFFAFLTIHGLWIAAVQ